MTLSDTTFSSGNAGAHGRLATAYAPQGRPTPSALPPKPVLSAWQRWEMDTLNAPAPAPSPSALGGRHTAVPDTAPSPALVHAAELAQLRREARKNGEAEGRREGLAHGRAEGHAEGRAEGLAAGLAAANAHAEQWRALAGSLPVALRAADREVADALLTLALDIARQVVHRTLRTEPEWINALVHDLLQAEPVLQGEPRLLLHPEDLALVRASLGHDLDAAGWHLRADESLARGGCRVQSASGELDASLETRWKRVTAALNRDADTQAL